MSWREKLEAKAFRSHQLGHVDEVYVVDALEILNEAVAEARRAAFEEAARLVEGASGPLDTGGFRIAGSLHVDMRPLAQEIRALAAKEPK